MTNPYSLRGWTFLPWQICPSPPKILFHVFGMCLCFFRADLLCYGISKRKLRIIQNLSKGLARDLLN
jgi:hypothetical protein